MIAVALVKSVPLGSGTLRPVGGRLSRDGVTHGIDAANELAIDWAVGRRDAGALDEVIAVAMAPSLGVGALRSALALGCDRAVHVCDEALAGADLRRTVDVLAATVEHLDAELVLCGYESADGSAGVVPAGLASRLGRPLLSRVVAATFDGQVLDAERDDGGGRQRWKAKPPAVISFVAGEIVPRRPTLKQTIAARGMPIDVLGLGSLGPLPEWTAGDAEVVGMREVPEQRRESLVLDPPAGVAEVVGRLKQVERGRE